jgi:amidophosphoribosyltransferase
LIQDEFRDECGVCGVFGHPEASNLVYLGIHALQHRGQESAGIVSTDGAQLHAHRDMGLVADVFNAATLEKLPGFAAVGHVRYSTQGPSSLKNAQPFAVTYRGGAIALAHNGNLINAESLREELEDEGAIFQTTSDTEVIIHLMARTPGTELSDQLTTALGRVTGAYSLVVLSERSLIGVRDPMGFRPLVLGRFKGGYILASETCALDLIEAEYIREVEPGEMIVINRDGLQSLHPFPPTRQGRCIFEHVYFARPDSNLFGQRVYMVRKSLGRQLAREQPAAADVVIPVPDSGVPAAMGFAELSHIAYDLGLIRSHYVGRTFIEPSQSIRHFGVKLKLNTVPDVLSGKRVVVVDDSIVRGTTSRKIVKMIRAAGAREVHLRISSPPTQWPCYFGIDTPTRQELIAASHNIEEIAKYVTADSVGYLSLDGLRKAVGSEGTYCDACFSGQYLMPVTDATQMKALKVVGV